MSLIHATDASHEVAHFSLFVIVIIPYIRVDDLLMSRILGKSHALLFNCSGIGMSKLHKLLETTSVSVEIDI